MIFCIAKENLEKQKKNGVIVFLSFLLGKKNMKRMKKTKWGSLENAFLQQDAFEATVHP